MIKFDKIIRDPIDNCLIFTKVSKMYSDTKLMDCCFEGIFWEVYT